MSEKHEKTGLRKELGLFHSVSIVGGIMIGSGIFYVSTYVLIRSGLSAGFAILAWVIAGFMSLMAALCYAELGTSMPQALRKAPLPCITTKTCWMRQEFPCRRKKRMRESGANTTMRQKN